MFARIICCLVALSASTVVVAEGKALSLPELQRCSSQVQQLRTDSSKLTQQSQQLNAERDAINQSTAELTAEDAKTAQTDLKSGLALHQRRMDNQAQAAALNARIAPLRREIDSLNLIKADYDRNCSGRPYRRADLESLPESQRSAMRAGMGDVQVPYIDPASLATATTR
ncbi:hypothetical protein [Hydrocarboniphaga sp.]|uniref:hypothetical protein n=1 Tax=Hydrocarboniphaga sp. TaxID=2033016 RepID=UPI003D12BCFD